MLTQMAVILGIMLSAAAIIFLEVPYMLRKRLKGAMGVFHPAPPWGGDQQRQGIAMGYSHPFGLDYNCV